MNTLEQIRENNRNERIRLRNRAKRAELKSQINNLEGHIEYYQKLYEAELTRKPITYPLKISDLKMKVEHRIIDKKSKERELQRYDSSDDEE